MKKYGIIIVLVLVGFFSGFIPVQNSQEKYDAVVELFTSEGCSSCPPADELLKEMSILRKNEGKPFIALSFHVTYWNRQGWTDSFSNEAYTERQKKYQAVLNVPQCYTPQAVVNGMVEFVGSNPIDFRNALDKMEDKTASYAIRASAQQKPNTITIEYTLNKEPRDEWMNVAIVEKENKRKITRGENRSRTLQHFNVVRDFKITDLKKQDSITFSRVDNLSAENMEIVMYIQHKRSMKILASCKFQLLE